MARDRTTAASGSSPARRTTGTRTQTRTPTEHERPDARAGVDGRRRPEPVLRVDPAAHAVLEPFEREGDRRFASRPHTRCRRATTAAASGWAASRRWPVGPSGSLRTSRSRRAATNVAQMNAPTVQVNYGTKYDDPFGQKHCGPYTLAKPAGRRQHRHRIALDRRPGLPRELPEHRRRRGPDQQRHRRLQREPHLRFTDREARRREARHHQVPNQPNFPRMPSATDNGGDCDPDQPGAEFVFGGDSHIYVPNGGLEICAGVNSSNPLTGQEIGVYGIPAVPRLVPASNPANTGTITLRDQRDADQRRRRGSAADGRDHVRRQHDDADAELLRAERHDDHRHLVAIRIRLEELDAVVHDQEYEWHCALQHHRDAHDERCAGFQLRTISRRA